MDRWAYFCAIACDDPERAAWAFLAEVSGDVAGTVLKLLNAALWRDADVQQLEEDGLAVLIEGRFGRFWFASPQAARVLLPPAPRIAPSGLVALARGLVSVLSVPSRNGR